MGTLEGEALLQAECSDRLYVPASVFQQHLQTTAVFLKLSNRVEQSVIGCMYAAHPNIEETCIYAPQSIVEKLEFDTEHISVEAVRLPTCTQITLQPFTPIEGLTMEQLQESMQCYGSMNDDQTLRLWHPDGYEYEIKVQSLEPATTVSISNCDIPLSMMQPMVPEEEEDQMVNSVVYTPEVGTIVPSNELIRTDVIQTPEQTVPMVDQKVTETVRERIYKAALARSQQLKPSNS